MIKNCQQNRSVSVLGMIPARYGSYRFPGKILAPILGKTLIQRTYENVRLCTDLDAIVIATDDTGIYDHIAKFGADVVMTSPSCMTGTDRLVEALKTNSRFDEAEIIINIQGDEPCIPPEVISKVINALKNDPEAVMSTAVTHLKSESEAQSPSVVKCVMDCHSNALYFSRALIPAGHKQAWRPDFPMYRHIGIYGYRRKFLLSYADLPPTPLQLAEDLEQLKVLENGYRIKVTVVDHHSIGVDVPEDIKKVEEWIWKQNTYS